MHLHSRSSVRQRTARQRVPHLTYGISSCRIIYDSCTGLPSQSSPCRCSPSLMGGTIKTLQQSNTHKSKTKNRGSQPRTPAPRQLRTVMPLAMLMGSFIISKLHICLCRSLRFGLDLCAHFLPFLLKLPGLIPLLDFQQTEFFHTQLPQLPLKWVYCPTSSWLCPTPCA